MLVGQVVPPAEQLLPVGAGGIILLVGAAFPQDRQHQLNETLQTLRNNGARQVESVDIGFIDPGDQLVCNLLRRADNGRLAAAQHEPVDQLPLGPAWAERSGDRLYIGANGLSGTGLDRLVHAIAAEVDAERGSGMCQGALDTGVAPVLRQKLASIPLGTTGHHAGTDKYQHWPRRGTRAQIGDNAAHILFGAAVDEHALGVAGGEYAAAVRGARLVQNRCALRRWLPQREGVDMELPTVMVHQPHPSRIGVDAPSAIALYRVVRPTALP